MGIPKFFRWMSERYPGLCKTAKEDQLPEIDNFYLDMNGIIHNCSHPNDGDVHFRITEAEMFDDIFNYVNTLFSIMKPQRYLFLAVDGVAPRAKMNQQRGRRFRSAKEASDREEAAIRKGDILPSEERFDSNCITPGTDFMIKLNKALKKFIEIKIITDPEWQKVKVILSGHETPGEGEHKIMDFIRYQRSQPNYDTETRHCLYGLDTDLIMLGLSSHEPNFVLLREEIKFNSKKSEATKGKSHRVDPTKMNFNVLYLNLLRDYIEKDFMPLKPKLPFSFDLEAIIDDWILICFLVGNDFIPHLPHFHIHKNALPKIFDVYKATLSKLDGYMNEKGILNLKRFRKFAKALAILDLENYNSLLKENGGECASDDFTKLNMFVRQKMRIHGISRDDGKNKYHKKHDHPTYHSQNHRSEVWYNISRTQNQKNGGPVSYRKRNNYEAQRDYANDDSDFGMKTNGNYKQSTPKRRTANFSTSNFQHTNRYEGYASSPKGSKQPAVNIMHKLNYKDGSGHPSSQTKLINGKPVNSNGRAGVHSFTEEQINNSITLCADGDFINLADEEYLSDEKFPSEKARHRRDNAYYKPNYQRRQVNVGRQEKVNEKDLERKGDFEGYKRAYYREKFKVEPTDENILMIVQEYVRALQWNLHYYYHGCISWGWYYPYHYAPLISDVVNFSNVNVKFDRGQPFKPLEQLLSVLPAASSTLLPKVYRSLVSSQNSPLARFFPTEVEYDLNGKQNDWEAVVLAPFIEEDVLLKASLVYNLFLTEEERKNNIHGPHVVFEYVPPKGGRNTNGQVRLSNIQFDGFNLSMDQIKFGLLKNTKKEAKKSVPKNVTLINQKFKVPKSKNYQKNGGNGNSYRPIQLSGIKL